MLGYGYDPPSHMLGSVVWLHSVQCMVRPVPSCMIGYEVYVVKSYAAYVQSR